MPRLHPLKGMKPTPTAKINRHPLKGMAEGLQALVGASTPTTTILN
jgi:hypothetical protein